MRVHLASAGSAGMRNHGQEATRCGAGFLGKGHRIDFAADDAAHAPYRQDGILEAVAYRDMALLTEVGRAHDWLSGSGRPCTPSKREPGRFGKAERARLAEISGRTEPGVAGLESSQA